MRKLSFKSKFYIFLAVLLILSFLADIFNLLELNRYNGLMVMLLLTILFFGIQYYAAKKGLDTMLSISRDYQIRKLWNTEKRFDWRKVRRNQLRWSPICLGISFILLVTLYLTGDKYSVLLLVIGAINLMLYVIFTRPLKHNSV